VAVEVEEMEVAGPDGVDDALERLLCHDGPAAERSPGDSLVDGLHRGDGVEGLRSGCDRTSQQRGRADGQQNSPGVPWDRRVIHVGQLS
jgi:hypothetical protein